MGATHKLESHSRCFSAEHPGKDAIEHLAPLIAMAIATHRREMLSPNALSSEGIQHLFQTNRYARRALLCHGPEPISRLPKARSRPLLSGLFSRCAIPRI